MRKALGIAGLLIVVLAACIMFIRLANIIIPDEEKEIDTSAGISYLAETESYDPDALRTEGMQGTSCQTATPSSSADMTSSETSETSETTAETELEILEIKDGNFRAAFDDIIIAGDSIVEAISAYGILDDDQVLAEIGAHTWHLSKVTDQIVSSNPKYLILHYGENELDELEMAPYFIGRYRDCIETLKEELPDTVIFVDSIFPVQEKAYNSEPYTVNIPYYNELIREMADDLDVIYIDYDPFWEALETDYYEPDGIHPVMSFYTEEYLPYVYTVAMTSKR